MLGATWGKKCGRLLANININVTTAAAAAAITTTTLVAHVGDDAFCGLSHKMQFDGAVQKQFFKLSTNLATAARRTTVLTVPTVPLSWCSPFLPFCNCNSYCPMVTCECY
ncbi:hypothetical protein ACLKA6_011307 [Drosophila palustris]